MMDEKRFNFLIVSDLHLSEGFRPEVGKWSPNEDFLSDAAFADFLCFHEAHRRNDSPWKLIIAGDGFEFLQILSLPAADANELDERITRLANDADHHPPHPIALPESRKQAALRRLDEAVATMQAEFADSHAQVIAQAQRLQEWGPKARLDRVWELERLVTEVHILACRDKPELKKSEREYGLGTTEPEAIWKLDRIAEGHPIFFSALAWFLDQGNALVIMKGNHDVDLFWPGVQERIRQLILDASVDLRLSDPTWSTESMVIGQAPEVLQSYVETHCVFEPWIYFEPGVLYVEHGNQYEMFDYFTNFLKPVLPNDEKRLRLPSGSFFVRYFFNKVEESIPFADNVRPMTRFLAWAFEHQLKQTAKLIIKHFPGLWKFVKELVVRTWRDYSKDEKIERLRKVAHKGRASEAEVRQLIEIDREHADLIAQGARGSLTGQHLSDIECIAYAQRVHPIKMITRYMQITIPAVLVVGFLLAVFVGPFIWEFLVSDTFAIILDRYLSRAVVLGIAGFVIKSIVIPLFFSGREKDTEHDYLYEASQKVWGVLQADIGQGPKPTVDYLIFGHTHDPDCRKVTADPASPWYVNTGSWLNCVDEVEEWDKLLRDFAYLQIVVDEKTSIPGLHRWNPISGRPERIRRRMESHSEEKQEYTT